MSYANYRLSSYVGGQLLMLTENLRGRLQDRKKIWRRGEIQAIREMGDSVVVELAWVARKRGGRYFLEDSAHEILISLRGSERGRNYTLIAREREVDLDLEMVYCFAEPSHSGNVPLAEIGEKRPRRRTSP
jgi:hypothetical protein